MWNGADIADCAIIMAMRFERAARRPHLFVSVACKTAPMCFAVNTYTLRYRAFVLAISPESIIIISEKSDPDADWSARFAVRAVAIKTYLGGAIFKQYCVPNLQDTVSDFPRLCFSARRRATSDERPTPATPPRAVPAFTANFV